LQLGDVDLVEQAIFTGMFLHLPTFLIAASTAAILFTGSIAHESTADMNQDLNRANTLLSQGKYTEAISLYDNVIRIYPTCHQWR